jgi:hypothetical protein
MLPSPRPYKNSGKQLTPASLLRSYASPRRVSYTANPTSPRSPRAYDLPVSLKQSIGLLIFDVIQSLIMLPFMGVLEPQQLLFSTVITVVGTVIGFHEKIRGKRRRRLAADEQLRQAKAIPSPPRPNRHVNKTNNDADILRSSVLQMKRSSTKNSSTTLSILQLLHDPLVEGGLKSMEGGLKSFNSFIDLNVPSSLSSNNLMAHLTSAVSRDSTQPMNDPPSSTPSFNDKTADDDPPTLFLIERILVKKRIIILLSMIYVILFNVILKRFLIVTNVRKYLILLSVTLPQLRLMHELLFSPKSQDLFDDEAMSTFTVHSIGLIVMVLGVTFEVPFVYSRMEVLFDFAWTIIFPTGVIMCVFEGWRQGLTEDESMPINAMQSNAPVSEAEAPSIKPHRGMGLRHVITEAPVEDEGSANPFNALYSPRRFTPQKCPPPPSLYLDDSLAAPNSQLSYPERSDSSYISDNQILSGFSSLTDEYGSESLSSQGSEEKPLPMRPDSIEGISPERTTYFSSEYGATDKVEANRDDDDDDNDAFSF